MKIRPVAIAAENGRLLVLDTHHRIWEHVIDGERSIWGMVELPDEPPPKPMEVPGEGDA